jgi:3-hydroxyisobutyrate dehydrogenase-like beta-hydroxyacid dehydrogenase
VAATPAEAAGEARILLTMLADGEAVEAAVTGPAGALLALGDAAPSARDWSGC